ncbi:hypothetical protein M440DRAFT_128461 [Trichoderma longibrachiatum ATCC 18648]|uniref:Uncharacterized protein n=1 Tax=Trichoderma longibrachiatum ATCC 18648 TaxID=983965 RepID=A0A2T4BVN0_TRILO|nr:hypothetical protein M440DRAFT_128461 [Trichoderma longibrachiatum ATCC 18648]
MSSAASATRPATLPRIVLMEAAEPVATVDRKVTFRRTVISPRTWTMLLAETARRPAISAGTAPSRPTGPRSNAPTARSLDTPRSVARSLPRNRTPMKARHTAAAAATTNSHSSPTPAMAAAP